jgi:lysophospholipase L1-like esterase
LGDSITASTRNLEDSNDLGGGYPKYAAERLIMQFETVDFTFLNRGIWGNETKDLLVRMQEDCVDLQPDIIVLFLGVNDTLRHAETGDLSKEQFEKQYGDILSIIKEKTKAKLLVIEPYLLMKDQYNRAKKRFDLVERIDSIRHLCKDVVNGYMPLDGLFASLYTTEDAESYTADGLHPNEKGARFIGEYCAWYLTPIVQSLL